VDVWAKRPSEVFMTTNNYLILANNEHPLYEPLKKIGGVFVDPVTDEIFEKKFLDYEKFDAVFDFTLIDSKKKGPLIDALSLQFNAPIISDLTFHWAERKMARISNLKGAISAVFTSPTNSYECFTKDEESFNLCFDLFSRMGKKAVKSELLEFGFTYPRIISMIVNEAYFALEEDLATKNDIDLAMKNGVNYPLGPFEWGKMIGLKYIVKILDELFFVHHDPRYRACPLLRREAFLKEEL
jgi:3-hydroxybutyryl-CoA dehydrogenase